MREPLSRRGVGQLSGWWLSSFWKCLQALATFRQRKPLHVVAGWHNGVFGRVVSCVAARAVKIVAMLPCISRASEHRDRRTCGEGGEGGDPRPLLCWCGDDLVRHGRRLCHNRVRHSPSATTSSASDAVSATTSSATAPPSRPRPSRTPSLPRHRLSRPLRHDLVRQGCRLCHDLVRHSPSATASSARDAVSATTSWCDVRRGQARHDGFRACDSTWPAARTASTTATSRTKRAGAGLVPSSLVLLVFALVNEKNGPICLTRLNLVW